jgi:FtsP/CotA-like multicopper oxidase with cupredoxin domain
MALTRTLIVLLAVCSAAASTATAATVLPNDNRHPAGRFANGVLTVRLELRAGEWRPESNRPLAIPVYAFAEEGRPAEDPGPLIRVEEGTEIVASIRNQLQVPATLHGFHSRPGKIDDAFVLAPGEWREVKFLAGAPGTYFYWADTRKTDYPPPIRLEEDTELAGAFIVDARGAARDDRVFVINLWLTKFLEPGFREQLAINGRSWPDTEQLTLTQSQPVRWRIINPTISDHAMHLHGFFYTITGVGDSERFDTYARGFERQVVTEHIDTGQTFEMTWVPERPGNWLFHCHMTGHMSTETAPELSGPDGPAIPTMHHDSETHSGMYGLVLGVHVRPGSNAATRPTHAPVAVRRIRLDVRDRPIGRYIPAGPAFSLGAVNRPLTNVGPSIILVRGEAVEITVTNHSHESTAVHWHGIELESYYDGVPGWAGTDAQLAPEIRPGGSFIARMTPPRAGTFIYHTHWHKVDQLASGLYGPLIVVEPGQTYDPATDKVFLIGRAGGDANHDPLLLNGSAQPTQLALTANVRYRFRFINITPNDSYLIASLTRVGKAVQWLAVAKDGASLPLAQAVLKEASQLITVGETYDFDFMPEGNTVYELSVATPTSLPPVQKLSQMIIVSPPK